MPLLDRFARLSFAAMALVPAASPRLVAEDASANVVLDVRVTGLFCPERVADLQLLLKDRAGLKLAKVEYATSEARFEIDPAHESVRGAPADQRVRRLDELLKNLSRHTFGARPRSEMPRHQLRYVEIPVVGLDCKACGLAAYEAVYQLDGVEQATAIFRDGLVTAWIDPARTDAAKLEAALVAKGVPLAWAD